MSMFNKVSNRKFKLALLASLIVGVQVFIRHFFDVDISVEEMLVVITPLLSFIGVEGVADLAQRFQEYKKKR